MDQPSPGKKDDKKSPQTRKDLIRVSDEKYVKVRIIVEYYTYLLSEVGDYVNGYILPVHNIIFH